MYIWTKFSFPSPRHRLRCLARSNFHTNKQSKGRISKHSMSLSLSVRRSSHFLTHSKTHSFRHLSFTSSCPAAVIFAMPLLISSRHWILTDCRVREGRLSVPELLRTRRSSASVLKSHARLLRSSQHGRKRDMYTHGLLSFSLPSRQPELDKVVKLRSRDKVSLHMKGKALPPHLLILSLSSCYTYFILSVC